MQHGAEGGCEQGEEDDAVVRPADYVFVCCVAVPVCAVLNGISSGVEYLRGLRVYHVEAYD